MKQTSVNSLHTDTKEIDEMVEKVKQNRRQIPENNSFVLKSVYEYADFTIYHDIEFIQNLYIALLKRQADDDGLDYYLSLLRSGEKTKTEIISLIRTSKEAKQKNVKLLGFEKRLILTKINTLPFVSYIAKTFQFLLFIPKYLKRLNQLESNLFYINATLQNNLSLVKSTLQTDIALLEENSQIKISKIQNSLNTHTDTQNQKFKDLAFLLEDNLAVMESKLDDKADIQDTVDLYKTLTKEKDTLVSYLNKVDTFIQEAKQRLPENLTNDELKQIITLPHNKFDAIYKSFEDNFRGTKQEIKNRLKIYLPFLENISLNKEDISILDIGSGRGEWLELLKENGYKAKGIDLNKDMVQECKNLSLDVEIAEAISYLKSLEEDSISLISGFHIIEHLESFDDVLELLTQSHRALKSNGMIIFETPNTRNILVGASDFYLDPSHQKPLHPMTMKFFAQKSGFRDAQSLVIKDGRFSDIDEIDFHYIDDYVYTGRDYAIVGTKA